MGWHDYSLNGLELVDSEQAARKMTSSGVIQVNRRENKLADKTAYYQWRNGDWEFNYYEEEQYIQQGGILGDWVYKVKRRENFIPFPFNAIKPVGERIKKEDEFKIYLESE